MHSCLSFSSGKCVHIVMHPGLYADTTKAAASQVQTFLADGANSSFVPNSTFPLVPPHRNQTAEAKAIGNLVAGSVQLGADLAASGHAVSLAADERVSHIVLPALCAPVHYFVRNVASLSQLGTDLGATTKAVFLAADRLVSIASP